MQPGSDKYETIKRLQQEVLQSQRLDKASIDPGVDCGLGLLEKAFPGGVFPLGAVHEFLSDGGAHAAATNAFIAGILAGLMQQDGYCIWVSNRRTLFPQALQAFGVAAHRIIFVDVTREREALWATEEALKCASVTAVVGEFKEFSFKESRRLQLAVEQSRVTGFIHRCSPRTENVVACVSRWKIKPLPAVAADGMPGVGNPRWQVQLLKVRNGRPGSWQMEWTADGFNYIHTPIVTQHQPVRKIS